MVQVFADQEEYSGLCVYTGTFLTPNVSGLVENDKEKFASVIVAHALVEVYESKEKVYLTGSIIGTRIPLSKLKFIKINDISGPFFNISIDVFDKTGVKIATFFSGKICNLSWWYGKNIPANFYPIEKDTLQVTQVNLDGNVIFKDRLKSKIVFSLSCLFLGGFMGFRSLKMLEY